MLKKQKPAPTTEQLRRAIDSGLGGDKVDFPDPAAAPLGTDDEAGGFPPTPEEREAAYRKEAHTPAPTPGRQGDADG